MLKRKPIEIPPDVAQQFAANMRRYHAEYDATKKDEIAAETRSILLQHMSDGSKLRLTEVIELFNRMRP